MKVCENRIKSRRFLSFLRKQQQAPSPAAHGLCGSGHGACWGCGPGCELGQCSRHEGCPGDPPQMLPAPSLPQYLETKARGRSAAPPRPPWSWGERASGSVSPGPRTVQGQHAPCHGPASALREGDPVWFCAGPWQRRQKDCDTWFPVEWPGTSCLRAEGECWGRLGLAVLTSRADGAQVRVSAAASGITGQKRGPRFGPG